VGENNKLEKVQIIEVHSKKVRCNGSNKYVEVDLTFNSNGNEKRKAIWFLFDEWKKIQEDGCWLE
jgi:hypothetical protein